MVMVMDGWNDAGWVIDEDEQIVIIIHFLSKGLLSGAGVVLYIYLYMIQPSKVVSTSRCTL